MFKFFVQRFQPLVGYRNFFLSFRVVRFSRIAGQAAFIADDFPLAVAMRKFAIKNIVRLS